MSRPPPRLYVESDLRESQGVELDAKAAHYLVNVLRLGTGDKVALFNGRDGEWLARIAAASRKACTLTPNRQTRPQEPASPLTLAFAPLKKSAMDFLVEKATELGVGRLAPVITDRTEAARVNGERIAAQAREAAEQCERTNVPEIAAAQPLTAFLADWPADQPLWVADETGGGRAFADALGSPAAASPRHGILIGPEGGFTPKELATLAALPFVNLIDLGPRILRAETAALASITCWQALLGDWQA
jgi:16S rRNA (uracil1498-N3)-methyltransferase